MILTVNNDPSRKWSRDDGKLLKEFDDYLLYSECGWHCLILYKEGNRILNVHFNSREERLNVLRGYGYNVNGNYMYKMDEAEKQRIEKESRENSDWPYYKYTRVK